MTSTPASRSARATTLAPRSWPSSPAFATITRILPMTISVAGTSRGPADRLVHAGDAVLGDDCAALSARGGQGGRGVRGGRRRGRAGDAGGRTQVHLDVPGRHRGARRRGDAEQRRDLGAARRRAG